MVTRFDVLKRSVRTLRHNAWTDFGEVAAQLGRNQSTISREIARGMTEHGYDALVAQKRAVDCLAGPKPRKLDTNPQLRALVIEALNSKWSPE